MVWFDASLLVLVFNYERHSTIIETTKILFVDNLMLGVQLADVSTRCSSHPQGTEVQALTRLALALGPLHRTACARKLRSHAYKLPSISHLASLLP